MAKTLVVTEEQLNEIINGTPYLKNNTDGVPEHIYSNETFASGPSDIVDEPATTKKIADMLTPDSTTLHHKGSTAPGGYRMAESYSKKDFEKKMLQELNKDLAGKQMTVVIPNQQDPTNPFTMTGDENYLHVAEIRAEKEGNKTVSDAIGQKLDAERRGVKDWKKTLSKMGIKQQIRPHQKNKGGKAHTPKSSAPSIYSNSSVLDSIYQSE